MNSPVEPPQRAASGENVTLPQYLARKLRPLRTMAR